MAQIILLGISLVLLGGGVLLLGHGVKQWVVDTRKPEPHNRDVKGGDGSSAHAA